MKFLDCEYLIPQILFVQYSFLGLGKKKDPEKLFVCFFSNPIGLAAGFDKDGVAAAIWDVFGFGFAELGTVTWHQQKGNPRPRLFRLSAEQAALNRMGFNNNGAIKVKEILEKQNLQKLLKYVILAKCI